MLRKGPPPRPFTLGPRAGPGYSPRSAQPPQGGHGRGRRPRDGARRSRPLQRPRTRLLRFQPTPGNRPCRSLGVRGAAAVRLRQAPRLRTPAVPRGLTSNFPRSPRGLKWLLSSSLSILGLPSCLDKHPSHSAPTQDGQRRPGGPAVRPIRAGRSACGRGPRECRPGAPRLLSVRAARLPEARDSDDGVRGVRTQDANTELAALRDAPGRGPVRNPGPKRRACRE